MLERRQTIQQPNYYSIIPASVRYCKEITGDEKLLFSELTCLANKFGYCYASNTYFANLYNVSPRTITRRITKLKECGFIKIVIEKDDMNRFKCRRIYIINQQEENNPVDNIVHTPIDNSVYTPVDKNVRTPIDKSVAYNNTRDINNTSMNITRENRDVSSDIEIKDIIESYNKICISLSPYTKIKKDDKKNITLLLSNGIDYIDLFQKVEQSDFLSGRNGKWRHCTFSWIIQPDNIKKILNGSYGNRSPSTKKVTNRFFELAEIVTKSV